ncbi:response regulator [Chryseobacterium sp. KACC 21268]|nr:response regulator [Chryseobacterium sp. KACC 21268]
MSEKKIMIYYGDTGILDVLEIMLKIEGYTVFIECNSTNLIKEINLKKSDLLLMDLWMPVVSGDQLLKTIRGTKGLENLPVLFYQLV